MRTSRRGYELRRCVHAALLGCAALAGPLLAAPASQPGPATAPATQPAVKQAAPAAATQPAAAALPAGATPIEAEVIEVAGRAYWAPMGTAVTDQQAWQRVKLHDRYAAGIVIRTGLGSKVVLQFGKEEPYTVVMIERLTLVSIASLYKTNTQKVSRVVISYGAVRGGVSEGGLQSSFVIDSTVATLTKRGTWDFRMFVERGTGRFEISLADRGLVEAINKMTRQRQRIRSGQYVTEAMRRWVEQTSFDRLIALQDLSGMTGAEKLFKAFHDSGLAALDAGAGANLFDLSKPGLSKLLRSRLLKARRQKISRRDAIQMLLQRLGGVRRHEGDFLATLVLP